MAKDDGIKVETDEEQIAKIDFDKEDVKQAADMIAEKGFVTKNDFPDTVSYTHLTLPTTERV